MNSINSNNISNPINQEPVDQEPVVTNATPLIEENKEEELEVKEPIKKELSPMDLLNQSDNRPKKAKSRNIDPRTTQLLNEVKNNPKTQESEALPGLEPIISEKTESPMRPNNNFSAENIDQMISLLNQQIESLERLKSDIDNLSSKLNLNNKQEKGLDLIEAKINQTISRLEMLNQVLENKLETANNSSFSSQSASSEKLAPTDLRSELQNIQSEITALENEKTKLEHEKSMAMTTFNALIDLIQTLPIPKVAKYSKFQEISDSLKPAIKGVVTGYISEIKDLEMQIKTLQKEAKILIEDQIKTNE